VTEPFAGYAAFKGDFIDYVIADKIVLPLDEQPFYTEKIARLRDCYPSQRLKKENSH
jgi:predicted O-linked N-acetylglucosamine transferase (SPINDLY family)